MKKIEERLHLIKKHLDNGQIIIMILGLGSVGTYLLDFLLSRNDEKMKIIVVGRNKEKLETSVNIVKISALIRHLNRSEIIIEENVDFNQVEQVTQCISKHKPDFIVNASRVYSGLKYGSISWKNLRAYGIWTPLAIKYIRNIMQAYELAEADGIVINTSYSDAVIPWMKSAGKAYPDYGSGNINHLIPRIKYAVAQLFEIKDYWNIEVAYATAHFHDVVISKEGQAEGVPQLLKVYYKDEELVIMQDELLALCKIAMPVDQKRNMMNASSNYDIIDSIISAITKEQIIRFFSPGAFGEIGGYPVIIDAENGKLNSYIDEATFSLHEMREANRKSIELDGIENISNGQLIYTDKLVAKVWEAFHVKLPKLVEFNEIDKVASLIVEDIIIPQLDNAKGIR